ncbi:hypothetical protein D082_29860 [Synechocystis sp. PCC 6714]|nr:hypothetical protein D082_29860 [Synechocystis sp. PCC 6714]
MQRSRRSWQFAIFLTDQQWIWIILTHFDIFLWSIAKAIAQMV